MDQNIKLGHYLKGQEPFGCFNTGMAAVIARSKQAKKYTGKQYIVGRDIDVLYNMTDVILRKMRGQSNKAKFYNSKKAAFREFNRINELMVASIKADIKTVNDLKSKAQAGDMAAALSLSDY